MYLMIGFLIIFHTLLTLIWIIFNKISYAPQIVDKKEYYDCIYPPSSTFR